MSNAAGALRIVFAALAVLFVAYASAPSAVAQTTQAQAAREGAVYLTGQWRVTGGYDGEAQDAVDFWVNFNADGTFQDRDGYTGRWIVSGANFTMFYPDDSHLGYVGAVQGENISGRFDGLHVAGRFRMRRM